MGEVGSTAQMPSQDWPSPHGKPGFGWGQHSDGTTWEVRGQEAEVLLSTLQAGQCHQASCAPPDPGLLRTWPPASSGHRPDLRACHGPHGEAVSPTRGPLCPSSLHLPFHKAGRGPRPNSPERTASELVPSPPPPSSRPVVVTHAPACQPASAHPCSAQHRQEPFHNRVTPAPLGQQNCAAFIRGEL